MAKIVIAGDAVVVTSAMKLEDIIINLNKLEEKLPAVLEEIAAEKATVMSNITVAQ